MGGEQRPSCEGDRPCYSWYNTTFSRTMSFVQIRRDTQASLWLQDVKAFVKPHVSVKLWLYCFLQKIDTTSKVLSINILFLLNLKFHYFMI